MASAPRGLTGADVELEFPSVGATENILTAAVLARGMTSPLSRMNVATGAMAFMLWEMVKIGLSIGMLMLAPSLVANLSWPALLVGLILTMKVYFVAAIIRPGARAQGQVAEASKN